MARSLEQWVSILQPLKNDPVKIANAVFGDLTGYPLAGTRNYEVSFSNDTEQLIAVLNAWRLIHV